MLNIIKINDIDTDPVIDHLNAVLFVEKCRLSVVDQLWIKGASHSPDICLLLLDGYTMGTVLSLYCTFCACILYEYDSHPSLLPTHWIHLLMLKGESVLMVATGQGRIECVQEILKQDAMVNQQDNEENEHGRLRHFNVDQ